MWVPEALCDATRGVRGSQSRVTPHVIPLVFRVAFRKQRPGALESPLPGYSSTGTGDPCPHPYPVMLRDHSGPLHLPLLNAMVSLGGEGGDWGHGDSEETVRINTNCHLDMTTCAVRKAWGHSQAPRDLESHLGASMGGGRREKQPKSSGPALLCQRTGVGGSALSPSVRWLLHLWQVAHVPWAPALSHQVGLGQGLPSLCGFLIPPATADGLWLHCQGHPPSQWLQDPSRPDMALNFSFFLCHMGRRAPSSQPHWEEERKPLPQRAGPRLPTQASRSRSQGSAPSCRQRRALGSVHPAPEAEEPTEPCGGGGVARPVSAESCPSFRLPSAPVPMSCLSSASLILYPCLDSSSQGQGPV